MHAGFAVASAAVVAPSGTCCPALVADFRATIPCPVSVEVPRAQPWGLPR